MAMKVPIRVVGMRIVVVASEQHPLVPPPERSVTQCPAKLLDYLLARHLLTTQVEAFQTLSDLRRGVWSRSARQPIPVSSSDHSSMNPCEEGKQKSATCKESGVKEPEPRLAVSETKAPRNVPLRAPNHAKAPVTRTRHDLRRATTWNKMMLKG